MEIINGSLSTGTFPEEWKESTVIPVPKVQNTKLHSEFRPINTVEVYEKVLEVVVKTQLVHHCNINKIIIPNQFGFRENHSCETVVINVCDNFVNNIDGGNLALAIFVDLRRAFETVNTNTLVKKMEKLGIRHNVLGWFKSYLDGRKQRVKYRDCLSDLIDVKYGVPLSWDLFCFYCISMMWSGWLRGVR